MGAALWASWSSSIVLSALISSQSTAADTVESNQKAFEHEKYHLQPPEVFKANSARSLSKPISTS